MSVSASLSAAGPLARGLFGLIDDIFTSDEERMQAKQKLIELEHSGRLAQIGVNKQEAKHTSLFVAGWRPFVGWTCGAALAWTFVLYPMISFAIVTFGVPLKLHSIPTLDLEQLMPLLFAMLGAGGMRSYEKRHGVARESMSESDAIDRNANS